MFLYETDLQLLFLALFKPKYLEIPLKYLIPVNMENERYLNEYYITIPLSYIYVFTEQSDVTGQGSDPEPASDFISGRNSNL